MVQRDALQILQIPGWRDEIEMNEGAFGGRPRSRRGCSAMDGWKLTAK
jgi:hypothetical protein